MNAPTRITPQLRADWIGEFAKAGQAKIPDVVQRVYVEDRKAYFAVTATQPSHALWFLNGDRYFEIDEEQITLTMAGGDLQKAVDASYFLGLPTISLQGEVSLTQPLRMRPGVSIWSMPGAGRITQAAGKDLTVLVDWDTYLARSAHLNGIEIDGDQAGRSQSLNIDRFACLIGRADDVRIDACRVGGIVGYGIFVSSGKRAQITNNEIFDCNVIAIFANAVSVGDRAGHRIAGNRLTGYIGNHAIALWRSQGCYVARNYISAQSVLAVAGNIVAGVFTRTGGSTLEKVRPGHYAIYSGGYEALVTEIIDANTIRLNTSSSAAGIFAAFGTGDLLTSAGGLDNIFEGNETLGGASLGCSATSSDGIGSDFGSIFERNTIRSIGSAGLSVQSQGSAKTTFVTMRNNFVDDFGLNGLSADANFSTGCTIGGSDSVGCVVEGNHYRSTTTTNRGMNIITNSVVRGSNNVSDTIDRSIQNGAEVSFISAFPGATTTVEAYEDVVYFSITTGATAPDVDPQFYLSHKIIPMRGKRASCEMTRAPNADLLPVNTNYPDDQNASGFQIKGTLAPNSTYHFVARL
ncbi:right-handed parallel beta-helix repeat-containing protein [Rhizobium sp. WW_1]|jgi:hypothetical protein|uniref:right-handed parallel beta-helix repeat-containing protein n=1 Tax=Rhizobium sp. WW_1 TaxID=1907375 RepID=UPI0006454F0A|nr:right-handed parallel beta-helix repeat-containing protein [Rhizobium sp. WW_1]RKD68963.1 hypothetical protein BJ928_104101 [Rhizobium sp. WW_1]